MKEESKKLKLNDVILSTKKRHQRNRSNSITTTNVNSVNIIKEIKENADLRRKRLVNNMLNLPRDDLIVDIALLNKLVFLELFLKLDVHQKNYDSVPIQKFVYQVLKKRFLSWRLAFLK